MEARDHRLEARGHQAEVVPPGQVEAVAVQGLPSEVVAADRRWAVPERLRGRQRDPALPAWEIPVPVQVPVQVPDRRSVVPLSADRQSVRRCRRVARTFLVQVPEERHVQLRTFQARDPAVDCDLRRDQLRIDHRWAVAIDLQLGRLRCPAEPIAPQCGLATDQRRDPACQILAVAMARRDRYRVTWAMARIDRATGFRIVPRRVRRPVTWATSLAWTAPSRCPATLVNARAWQIARDCALVSDRLLCQVI